MSTSKSQNANKMSFPVLTHHNYSLIVDRAWVNARQKLVLVEIDGRYFEIELDAAKAGEYPWPKLDQCDLMPVDHGPAGSDWPLGQEGHNPSFRFILRSQIPELKSAFKFDPRVDW